MEVNLMDYTFLYQLRTRVKKKKLRLKQLRILSGVIPLLLKLMLDRAIFVCAALTDFMWKKQKLLFTSKYADLLVFGITVLCENSH